MAWNLGSLRKDTKSGDEYRTLHSSEGVWIADLREGSNADGKRNAAIRMVPELIEEARIAFHWYHTLLIGVPDSEIETGVRNRIAKLKSVLLDSGEREWVESTEEVFAKHGVSLEEVASDKVGFGAV